MTHRRRQQGRRFPGDLRSGTAGREEQNYIVCTHAYEGHADGLPSVLTVYPTGASVRPTETYIENINSKKIHILDCASLPKEENRICFSSYDDAANAGYTPAEIVWDKS